MVFVNQIAHIVHYATNKYAGAANKNVGDAFLLVWRLKPEDAKLGVERGMAMSEAEVSTILEQQLMDNALFALLKVIVDIENSNKWGVLKEYARHPKIMERFPGGFKVHLGFGLHFGWAIEGAKAFILGLIRDTAAGAVVFVVADAATAAAACLLFHAVIDCRYRRHRFPVQD
jgi:hypothetical protein